MKCCLCDENDGSYWAVEGNLQMLLCEDCVYKLTIQVYWPEPYKGGSGMIKYLNLTELKRRKKRQYIMPRLIATIIAVIIYVVVAYLLRGL